MKRYFIHVSLILLFLPAVIKAQFIGGSGTSVDPYIITTPSQLDAIRSGMDKHYKLGNDIDLTAYLAQGGAGYSQ